MQITKRKVSEHDTIMLMLLYIKLYTDKSSIMYKKYKRFDEAVNRNLIAMDSRACDNFMNNEPTDEYYYFEDDEEGYLTLNQNLDLDEATKKYFDLMPQKVLEASQMNNALCHIDLENQDGQIVKKGRVR